MLIVGTRHKSVQERLLEKGDGLANLDEAIEIARTYEATSSQMAQLGACNAANSVVCEVRKSKPRSRQTKSIKAAAAGGRRVSVPEKCQFCGKSFHERADCPARAAECRGCHKIGHFQKVCRSSKRQVESSAISSVSTVSCDCPDLFLGSVGVGTQPWTVTVYLAGTPVQMRVDTGADVSVIPASLYSQQFSSVAMADTSRTLSGPGTDKLDVKGVLHVTLSTDSELSVQDVYVVKDLQHPLLGRPAIQALNILPLLSVAAVRTPVVHDLQSAKKEFPKLFGPLGEIAGEPYNISLQDDAKPVSLACPRRVPIPLMPKVKEELDRMLFLGIIVPVEQPTSWCSAMVVVPKSSGAVRLCVDFTTLNKYVRRERVMLPSVDHTLAQLKGAKFFTRLDANSGFYQVPLSENSQELITFITPFGRYMFTRMPFGISSAPEHFQRRMSEVLAGVPGVVCQMDDALVFGGSDESHDAHLAQVLQRLSDAGVTLNEGKCMFKQKSVHFLGHVIDESGIRADPDKMQAMTRLPSL